MRWQLKDSNKGEFRRIADETIDTLIRHGISYCQLQVSQQFVLAFLAGSFISFGAALSVFLSIGVEEKGIQTLLLAFGFAAGFTLVILSGVALFTEVNVVLPIFIWYYHDDGRQIQRALCFWGVTWVGNIAGALFVGAMLEAADTFDDKHADRLFEIIRSKMRTADTNTGGAWFRILASAVLGNWLVGMAAWNATSARTIPGKVVGLFFPVVSFAAMGLQHAPANMGYFFIALIHGGAPVTWGDAIGWNLIPSSLGNLLGAVFMVAALLSYAYAPRKGLRSQMQQAASSRQMSIVLDEADLTAGALPAPAGSSPPAGAPPPHKLEHVV